LGLNGTDIKVRNKTVMALQRLFNKITEPFDLV